MTAAPRAETGPVSRRTRGQIWLITVGAIAIVILLNEFSGKRDLSPMDFIVGGQNAVQWCDPNTPRFFASGSTPQRAVTAEIQPPPPSGGAAQVLLRATSGKIIRAADLLPTEGRTMRLFVVDRSLGHFEEKDNPPELSSGEWLFTDPAFGGPCRLFADFTPKATQKEIYTWADFAVPARLNPPPSSKSPEPSRAAPEGVRRGGGEIAGPYRVAFSASPATLYARVPFTVNLTVTRSDGGRVPVVTVAGVAGDLLAFDADRTGMAKFECRAGPLDPVHPTLTFRGAISDPGSYVFWADLRAGALTVAAPFRVTIQP